KMIVQIGKRLVRQRTMETSNEALCHPARRMKDLLELADLRRGILRAVFDFEKREVFLRNEPELEQAQLPFWGCFHVNANFGQTAIKSSRISRIWRMGSE